MATGCRDAATATALDEEDSDTADDGDAGDDSDDDGDEGDDDDDDDPAPESGAAPLRRLTAAQYRGVVQQQLDVDVSSLSLPADGRVGPFVSNAETPLSGLHIDQYFAAAMAIGEQVDLALLHDCGIDPDDECVSAFIDAVGRRVFRRPVPDDDAERLAEVYETARDGGGPEHGLRAVLSAMLQSPYFLYHVEIGTPTDADDPEAPFRLTGYEVASRLSFLLWNLAPDAELLDAAAGGLLDDREGIANQAQRLLEDDRALAQIGAFHLQWLGAEGIEYLVKDPARYPFWTDPQVRLDLRQEVFDLAAHLVLETPGTAGDLVTVPFSFLRGDLFRIYGVGEPPGHDPSTPIGLDPTQRAGVLTLPAVLATHAAADETSPVHRGLFVLENLLCLDIASPPPDVDTTLPPSDPEEPKSRRELLEQHQADPQCAACHVQIDPAGLLFEHYDAVGAWRDYDFDFDSEIDATVTLETGTDVDGSVASPVELGQRLAQSQAYRRCVVLQWTRFALGRELTPDDASTIAELLDAADDDVVIRELIIDIVTSDAFSHRPSHPEDEQ